MREQKLENKNERIEIRNYLYWNRMLENRNSKVVEFNKKYETDWVKFRISTSYNPLCKHDISKKFQTNVILLNIKFQ